MQNEKCRMMNTETKLRGVLKSRGVSSFSIFHFSFCIFHFAFEL